MRIRTALAPLAAATVVLLLAGCTSATSSLETECRQAVADHLSIPIDDVEVTWENETPGGALDWRGEYGMTGGGEYGNPGTFACGANSNPTGLTQVMVVTATGEFEVVPL